MVQRVFRVSVFIFSFFFAVNSTVDAQEHVHDDDCSALFGSRTLHSIQYGQSLSLSVFNQTSETPSWQVRPAKGHNSGDIFPVGTTTVTYTATDSAGNISTCSFNITVSMPKLTVVYEDVSCNGASDGTATVIVTDAVGPLTFDWGTAGTDSIATGLIPGTYTVVVSDGIGCSATASVTITEPTVLTVDTVSITIGSCGFENGSAVVVANGGTAPYSYSWSNGQASATLNSVGDGFYTVTVTDANGCQDSLTINVSCEIKEIPQLITPNGDGYNDTWVIPGIEKYPDATVEVYNRWGNLVFKSAPYLNDWAGISTGMLNVGNNTLPAGTYFYVIRLHPQDKKAMTGYLELQY